MEKVSKYEIMITQFLEEFVEEKLSRASQSVDNQIIVDKENKHYQLIRIGWEGKYYHSDLFFHFDIKNEKIWIQQNNTECLVADYFTDRGVPKSDIVLGFQPEYARPYTGFATA